MSQLLSIKDISRQTGLEESLLRFYESEYPDELPQKALHDHTLSFDVEAVQSFKRIHALHTSSPQQQNILAVKRGDFGRVIAITSGKGGVGKTNIALNLAIELQRFGKMCVLLDGDMGMANVHLLAGLEPQYNILEIISGNKDILELIMEGPEGIGVIPGGGGIMALADSSQYERLKIIRALTMVEKEADILLVDTGAGMGGAVRDFLVAADEIIFILTPDITSLADAYGLLKALHSSGFAERPIYSVINMAQTLKHAAQVALRFSGCAQQFLGCEIKNLGYILKDSTVGAATARRTPYSVFRPQARASINTRNLAINLLKSENPALRISSAFSRYLNILNRDDNMSVKMSK